MQKHPTRHRDSRWQNQAECREAAPSTGSLHLKFFKEGKSQVFLPKEKKKKKEVQDSGYRNKVKKWIELFDSLSWHILLSSCHRHNYLGIYLVIYKPIISKF